MVKALTKYCPTCDAEKCFLEGYAGFRFAGQEFGVVFCEACGLGVTEPFPDKDRMRGFYSSDKYRGEGGGKFVGIVERVLSAMLFFKCRRVASFMKSGASRLLDVGCGRGDFLFAMKKRGFDVRGIEMDERRSRYAKEAFGIEVTAKEFSESGFADASFDCVTAFHVLEHVERPKEFIRHAVRVLRPGGVFIAAVPNLDSLQSRITKAGWLHLDIPCHLYHFSEGNLKAMMERAGLQVGRTRHFTFDQNVFGFLQSLQNLVGFRHNLLFDLLKSAELRRALFKGRGAAIWGQAFLMALTLPLFIPVAFVLSLFEALIGRGGTVDIHAVKK